MMSEVVIHLNSETLNIPEILWTIFVYLTFFVYVTVKVFIKQPKTVLRYKSNSIKNYLKAVIAMFCQWVSLSGSVFSNKPNIPCKWCEISFFIKPV